LYEACNRRFARDHRLVGEYRFHDKVIGLDVAGNGVQADQARARKPLRSASRADRGE
jgi:hypothetical protein